MYVVFNVTVSITSSIPPNKTTRCMTDLIGFLLTFPPSPHDTYNPHTNTYHESFDCYMFCLDITL